MVIFRYIMLLAEAHIPETYWSLALADMSALKADYREFVEYYIERLDRAAKKGLGILFFGSNGTGKTSMMCEIGKQAVVEGYKVRYLTAHQYVESTKPDATDTEYVEDVRSADFILLDEMDKMYIKTGSNYAVKQIEDFLRTAAANGRAVIACTNLDEDTFSEVFGESIVSLLKRHLKFIVVEGEDYSLTLQDTWDEVLESEENYHHQNIVEMAQKLQDREAEEYARGWHY